ncbi:unnamed protein product, partial [marine sediment metagenome]
AVNSVPAISAHVTDYARLYLWKLIQIADIVNCFYCDTDSLIVNEKGYKNLSKFMDKDRLGWLKVEDVSSCVDIRGAKNYTFGDNTRMKLIS